MTSAPLNPFFFLLLFPLALLATEAPDVRPVVRIGIAVPVTGNMAHVGESIVAWEKKAAAEISQTPTALHYEFVVEDDMSLPRQTALTVRRLVQLNKVRAFLTYTSGAGVAAAPYAENTRTPHIAIAYDSRAVAGEYSLSYIAPISDHMPPFLKLIAKRQYKKLALFMVLNSTWKPALDALHTAAADGAFEIAYEKIYEPGTRDFRLGFQMIPDDVEAVIFLSGSPEISIMGTQYCQVGPRKPLLSVGGVFALAPDKSLFEGAIDVHSQGLFRADKMNRQLTGQPIYSTAGPSIHDEMLLFVKAYEELYRTTGRTASSEEVMRYLHGHPDWSGAIGDAHLGDDKYYHMPIAYAKIENGQLTEIPFDQL